ncbi:MAG TPA: hypothetical protein VGN34_19750 [Ktedonobacteraceae bacterium]
MTLKLYFWTARRRFCYNGRDLQVKRRYIRLPHWAQVALLCHQED